MATSYEVLLGKLNVLVHKDVETKFAIAKILCEMLEMEERWKVCQDTGWSTSDLGKATRTYRYWGAVRSTASPAAWFAYQEIAHANTSAFAGYSEKYQERLRDVFIAEGTPGYRSDKSKIWHEMRLAERNSPEAIARKEAAEKEIASWGTDINLAGALLRQATNAISQITSINNADAERVSDMAEDFMTLTKKFETLGILNLVS